MTESPTLQLPADKRRVKQLEAKLEEYHKRLNRLHPLSRQLHEDPRNFMRHEVLKALLKSEGGVVSTHNLSLELSERFNGLMPQEISAFDEACAIIEDYCATGGQNTIGGSLPQA